MVRLPRLSNGTDVEALAAESGVEVLVTTDPHSVAGADLVVLPGTRSTVSDLGWLRRTGLAQVIESRVRRGAPVLGICGGYQMLARVIDDSIESASGRSKGSDCFPPRSDSAPRRCSGGPPAGGMAIRSRRTRSTTGLPSSRVRLNHSSTAGGEAGWGTMWHGAWENDGFRRAWLAEIADAADRRGVPILTHRRIGSAAKP